MYSFKDKYGVNLTDSQKLLKIAKNLGMQVIGLCFHVGCSAKNPKAYYYAVKDCKKLFTFARDELGLEFSILNLGGGYSSCFEGCSPDLGLPFERVARSINEALDKFFPSDEFSGEKLQIVAEPGRYFCQRAYSLCVSIFNKKKYLNNSQIMSEDGDVQPDRIMYYVNQGIYSAFSCVFWDHKSPPPRAVYTKGKIIEFSQNMENSVDSTVWGPTCDGGDWVFLSIPLPELEIGDWMIWDNIGAYSSSIITNFNGFAPAEILWID
jgi:ornithine decarboxylase